MKPKSTFLILVFGLVVALFACENQGVVEPDDVISPDDLMVSAEDFCDRKPDHPRCTDPPVEPPPTGEPTLNLTGVLEGYADTDVSWGYKKGLFSARVMERESIEAVAVFPEDQDWVAFKESCKSRGGDAAGALMQAVQDGDLVGKLVNMFVDVDLIGSESPDHRILSLVEGPLVRYFWYGPRYAFEDEFPDDFHNDAVVTDFDDDQKGTITYTLTGGVLGVRDTKGPKTHTQIACPNPGSIHVKISPNTPETGG